MQSRALALRREGRRIGLVPTMGYLHAGHLSLIRAARERSDVVVVSIFVNPLQFGPSEDYGRYPRDLGRDERLCAGAGVDVLFLPEAADLYAPDFSTCVEETRLSRPLCGARRPGHFRGVTTVVAKLFLIVQPDVAVFGQKDAQQARVIRRMVRDLNFPVEILIAPTVREPEGLAMSSRNVYLSAEDRPAALCLRRALDAAEAQYRAGVRDAATLRAAIRRVLDAVPQAEVEYVEIVDDHTLEPVDRIERDALVALAVWVGKTRLIDNTVLSGG
jgi:pantoate--beta-alanine ligase